MRTDIVVHGRTPAVATLVVVLSVAQTSVVLNVRSFTVQTVVGTSWVVKVHITQRECDEREEKQAHDSHEKKKVISQRDFSSFQCETEPADWLANVLPGRSNTDMNNNVIMLSSGDPHCTR